MDDVATESIEHGDQEIKRPTRVDMADVNLPILVDFRWLNDACILLAGGDISAVQTPTGLENSIRGAWADGDDTRSENRAMQGSKLSRIITAPSRCRKQVQGAWRSSATRPAPATRLWTQYDKCRGFGGRANKMPNRCLFVQYPS